MTSIPPLRSAPIAIPQRAPAARGTPESASPASQASARETQADDILTAEEREFFANRTALGPLTYRPRGTATEPPAPPTGQRIDVRG